MRLKLYRGKWSATWREGGTTRRVSLRTADRGAAERRLKDLIDTQARERAGKTIADAVEAYLSEKEGRARSYKSMETAWRALKPMFAHLRPDQVTRELCRDYTAKRRKGGVSNGTIIKDLGFLRAALKWSGRAGQSVFELPNAPPPKTDYLTREQFEALVAACTLAHLRLFVILAVATGGRSGALLELTWDRVNFDKGLIALGRGAGGLKGRATVPMTDRARAALEAAYEARETDYVIEWGGKPVTSLKRSFATACELAGIKGITPHALRHTSAVWMAEAGVPMDEIAQYLGHSNPRITYRVYAKFSPGHLRRAAQALE